MTLSITTALSLCLLAACSTEPKPIEYNVDQCAECKMMISDQRFGAELVTSKGKLYKYDAAECMINALQKNRNIEHAHILVTDFTNPSQLIDARTAFFLINTDRPSPMGANLSAYASKQNIDAISSGEESIIYNWEELMKNL